MTTGGPIPGDLPMPVFRRVTLRGRLAEIEGKVLASLHTRLWAMGPTRERTLNWLRIGAVVALVGGGVGGYFALRPVPQPDYETAGIDDIFNFTLLTDEFNQLPVEQRMKLIAQLIARLRDMKPSESLLLASFAAGIQAQAREQIEENGARLAVDAWDMYAKDYAQVPEGERVAYLEGTFVEFTKMLEAVAGEQRDVTDAERINEVRAQAKSDMEEFKDPEKRPDNEGLGNILGFMNNTVAARATPQQRVRGQQMMRDMMRHFRGQDVATGAPAAGGDGGGG